MKAFRGPKVWLWRWRRNPLKRRADVLEGWVVLGVWLLTVLTGVLGGLAADRSVEHGLARERATWRPAPARVVAQAPGAPRGRSHAPAADGVWARVRWTLADGSVHTGEVRVAPGSPAGTRVTVWTDPQGHLVTRPVDASGAAFRAGLIGVLVGVSTAAVPFVGGLVLRGRMERRRLDRWETEWARWGPQWRRMV
ncbi:Rv1733c family protein [Streptomyces sp. NPDC002676]